MNKLLELKEELLNVKLAVSSGKEKNYKKITTLKKNIARLITKQAKEKTIDEK